MERPPLKLSGRCSSFNAELPSHHRRQVKLVHKLQRLLVKSWYGRLLAVRRVTQDNRGKRTAGIDGVKSLTPHQRLQLALSLSRFSSTPLCVASGFPNLERQRSARFQFPSCATGRIQALIKLAWSLNGKPRLRPKHVRLSTRTVLSGCDYSHLSDYLPSAQICVECGYPRLFR